MDSVTSGQISVPRGPIRARCFTVMVTGYFLAMLSMLLQPLMFQYVSVDLGAGEVTAGLVLMVEMIGGGLSSALAGRFLPRAHARAGTYAGLILAVAASGAAMWTKDMVLLACFRFFAGAGLGVSYYLMNIIAANMKDPDKVYAQVQVANVLMSAALTAGYGTLQSLWPSLNPYGLCFWVTLIGAPVVLMLPSMSAFDFYRQDDVTAASQAAPLRARKIRAQLGLLCTVMAVVTIGSGAVWTLVSHLGEEAGLSSDVINSSISISMLVSLLGLAMPATVGQKFGRVIPVTVASIAIYGAIVVLLSHPGPTAFSIAVAVNTGALYCMSPFLSGAAAAVDGGGRIAAYTSSVFLVASSVSPMVGGFLGAASPTTGAVAITGGALALFVILCFVWLERLSLDHPAGGHAAGLVAR